MATKQTEFKKGTKLYVEGCSIPFREFDEDTIIVMEW